VTALISSRALLTALGVSALLVGESASADAHDFWVQPDAYWVASAAHTPFTLQLGHGPDRQRSPIPLSRILRFEAVCPDARVISLRSTLQLGGRSSDGTIALAAPGTYVLVLQTDARARSLLPAIRFNDYLRVEGLTPALRFRERKHRMSADGSESYSRQAKAIVRVGPSIALKGEASRASPVTRSIGLPLEIVPELDPYAIPPPKRLPVRVIYKGRPLAGALIKLSDLHEDAHPIEVHLTDSAGRATFMAPMRGAWLLNVIWTELAPPSSDTDFETVFSSLSFGFPTNYPVSASSSMAPSKGFPKPSPPLSTK
jgi:uncharacterized GH25 family protein